jgi:hypothetical protein
MERRRLPSPGAAACRFLLPLCVALVAAPAEGQSIGPLVVPDFIAAPAASPPPLRLAESALLPEPLAELQPATVGAVDRLEAMRARNAAGFGPVQIGFTRPLPLPARLRLDSYPFSLAPYPAAGGLLADSPDGRRLWGTRVRVAGAYRLRLLLRDVELPEGSRLWVWGAGERARSFGLELRDRQGDLWTPSVEGEEIFLEVELPQGSGGPRRGFAVEEVLEIFRLGRDGAPALGPVPEPLGECLVDSTCVTSATLGVIAELRQAIALLHYVEGISAFSCSGGLLNDSVAATVIPYLLTANHCFSTQPVANTLEAFWDFRSSVCDGAEPDLDSLSTSNGATLLASSEESDFTLVRLNSIPGGRTLLGWNANPQPNGAVLHRVSHPMGLAQRYSRSTKTSTGPTCVEAPVPDFIYSALNQGGTFGGSSGSPVILAGGFVVGQLGGACGDNPADGCDSTNREVDGAFATTFPAIAQFLNPATPGACNPTSTALCLNGGRFRVEATFQSGAGSGTAQVVELTDETGYLWFFNANNVEAVVKVINACGLNNRYWVFAGGLTDVRTDIVVTDTQTGAVKTYINPQGKAFQPIQDTSAFATCP